MAEWTKERHQKAKDVLATLSTLTHPYDRWGYQREAAGYLPDALDAIEQRDAEIARLRAGLAVIESIYPDLGTIYHAKEIARITLEGGK